MDAQEFLLEQVVPRKAGTVEQAAKVLLILTCAAFVGGLFFRPLLLPAVALAAAWFLVFRRGDVEFEFTFLDGSLDVAAVYRKSRRKELLSARMEDAVFFGPADAPEAARHMGGTVLDCRGGHPDARAFCLALRAAQRETALLFEPDARLEAAVRRRIPRSARY